MKTRWLNQFKWHKIDFSSIKKFRRKYTNGNDKTAIKNTIKVVTNCEAKKTSQNLCRIQLEHTKMLIKHKNIINNQ